MRRNVADNVGLPGLERRDARGVLLNRFVNDFVDFRRRAPITFVAPDDELPASLPTGELEWPRADRPVVRFAHLFRGRLLHDHAAVDVLERVRVGLFECQDDGVIVGRVHFADVLQIGRLQAVLVGENALKGRDHIFARERRAVVEANPFAQIELQFGAFHLPGLRQHAAVAAFFVVGVDQWLHDRTPSSLQGRSVDRVRIEGINADAMRNSDAGARCRLRIRQSRRGERRK